MQAANPGKRKIECKVAEDNIHKTQCLKCRTAQYFQMFRIIPHANCMVKSLLPWHVTFPRPHWGDAVVTPTATRPLLHARRTTGLAGLPLRLHHQNIFHFSIQRWEKKNLTNYPCQWFNFQSLGCLCSHQNQSSCSIIQSTGIGSCNCS